MSNQGRFSRYKYNLRRYLVRRYNWDVEKAKNQVEHNPTYIKEIMNSGISAAVLAQQINGEHNG